MPEDQTKPICLALQGGGAHGAFTWGVLDRLLQAEDLKIEAISATSAGAMNAVVLAHGYSVGGRDGAREALGDFWREISDAGALYNPARSNPMERWFRDSGWPAELMPSHFAFQTLTQLLSPQQFNPLDINPLRTILSERVDFDRLRTCRSSPRLYLSATNVRSGKIEVFENDRLGVDVIMASACLPTLFKPVEIDGEAYWDGGFMGNPPIFPLIYRDGSRDVVIVHIDPLRREDVPATAPSILDRINEISFNSSLMREMRAIAFVTRLIDDGALDAARYRRMLIHSIHDDATMQGLGVASKLDTDWTFLSHLQRRGCATADAWLSCHGDDIGRRSSVDVAATYL